MGGLVGKKKGSGGGQTGAGVSMDRGEWFGIGLVDGSDSDRRKFVFLGSGGVSTMCVVLVSTNTDVSVGVNFGPGCFEKGHGHLALYAGNELDGSGDRFVSLLRPGVGRGDTPLLCFGLLGFVHGAVCVALWIRDDRGHVGDSFWSNQQYWGDDDGEKISGRVLFC